MAPGALNRSPDGTVQRRCHGDPHHRSPAAARAAQIPVRQITDDDLKIALRQGLDDFLDLRGDLFFAGLIYTLIGLAAVVMTTNMPLLPFFFPVVAGVGLLGPIAAVGFYELARRREAGPGSPLVQLPGCPQAPDRRRHGHGRRPAAGDLCRLAGRRGNPLRFAVRLDGAAVDPRFPRAGLHYAARLGADRDWRRLRSGLRLGRCSR